MYCIKELLTILLPMHATCPGSGSHSLFPIHTDVLGPIRINPGGHVYVMNCPSIGGLS